MDNILSTGLYFGLLSTLFYSMPWECIFLLTRLIGIYYYTIEDRFLYQRIQNKIKYSTIKAENDMSYGYAFGKWFVCHISKEDFEGRKIRLLTTEKTYKKLIEETSTMFMNVESENNKEEKQQKENSTLSICERAGKYGHFYYRKRDCLFRKLYPKECQNTIMENIKKIYSKRGNCVSLIYGSPGTGKSMLGILLASEYSGIYCNSMNFLDPGDSLSELYSHSQPTFEKPLIVSIDEADLMIEKIHKGFPLHNKIPTQVHDKRSWNRLFDDINRGLYPNIIFLLTMNSSPDKILEMDPSYIREGRVDFIHVL